MREVIVIAGPACLRAEMKRVYVDYSSFCWSRALQTTKMSSTPIPSIKTGRVLWTSLILYPSKIAMLNPVASESTMQKIPTNETVNLQWMGLQVPRKIVLYTIIKIMANSASLLSCSIWLDRSKRFYYLTLKLTLMCSAYSLKPGTKTSMKFSIQSVGSSVNWLFSLTK